MEFLENCRICLTAIKKAGIEITRKIKADFLYLTNEEFEEFGEHSNKICKDCFSELQNSCKFKELIVESQKRLRKKYWSLVECGKLEPLDFIKTEPAIDIPAVFVASFEPEDPAEVKIEEPDNEHDRDELINFYLNVAKKNQNLNAEESHRGSRTKSNPTKAPPTKPKEPKTKPVDIEVTFQQEPTIFKCDMCDKVYRKKLYLNVHKRTNHYKLYDKRFSCDFCGYRVHKKYHLKLHMLRHTKVEPTIQCNICDKTYHTQNKLKNHIRLVHKRTYDMICPQCGKICKGKTALDSHVNSAHLGLLPFSCDLCGKCE
jgi:uncharacterized C2H2 Zn-finger protein